ncbi:MAG: hypothetical protein ACO1TE_12345 [Prosthecobacter sp.]
MKHFLILLGLVLLLAGCATPPTYLNDDTIVPPGSRVSFWVLHDEHAWRESKLHIITTPRRMTGAELRMWAEGAGKHDADMRWTAFYVLVTLPGPERKTLRSRPLSAHGGRFP